MTSKSYTWIMMKERRKNLAEEFAESQTYEDFYNQHALSENKISLEFSCNLSTGRVSHIQGF